MSLYDALLNWLQLKLVADHRPNDEAAVDSLKHLVRILEQDHQVTVRDVKKEAQKYYIDYEKDKEQQTQELHAELAEQLLQFISDSPELYEFD